MLRFAYAPTTTVGPPTASSNNTKTANTTKTTTTTTTEAKPQLPRSARSRPQTAAALLMLAALMCAVSGGIAAPAPAPAPAQLPATLGDPLASTSVVIHPTVNRTRLQKRHYNGGSIKARFYSELKRTELYWSNACGGNWTGPASDTSVLRPHNRCAQHKKLLRQLQKKARSELNELRTNNKQRQQVNSLKAQVTSSNQAIDISKYRMWSVHSSKYEFLPRLNTTEHQLALRRVHNDLQFYVAAFSYLRHAQLHWDYENIQKQSVLSSELQRLRASARSVLCLVEEAINGTSRLYAPIRKNQRQKMAAPERIKTVPLHLMEKRLHQFQTPLVALHRLAVLVANNESAAQPTKPFELDALFLKYHYMKYLKHITQLLAKQRKRNCTSRPGAVAPRPKLQKKQRPSA
ncbi:uncharacterized protein LOC6569546 [Drosophila grimshawi]|uniref:uncharacterized protein LOC6569546 n=1 Tax=Drosophila grimshawi TaxID=7222 RepID=UPI001C935610|nr:uncharacterized protein LOC6569546 [Drosophila grimshawi]